MGKLYSAVSGLSSDSSPDSLVRGTGPAMVKGSPKGNTSTVVNVRAFAGKVSFTSGEFQSRPTPGSRAAGVSAGLSKTDQRKPSGSPRDRIDVPGTALSGTLRASACFLARTSL